ATSVLVGMHPVLTHVPPNFCRSMIAAVMPAAENRSARDGPACPVPMMIASKCRVTISSFKIMRPSARQHHKSIASDSQSSETYRNGKWGRNHKKHKVHRVFLIVPLVPFVVSAFCRCSSISLSSSLEKLGFTFESRRAPLEVVVID